LRNGRLDLDFERAWNFSIVAPKANCSLNDTVEQMGVKLRQDLYKELQGKNKLSFLRGVRDQEVPNGCVIEISHLGAVVLKGPVVDWAGQIQMTDEATANCISLLTYAKVRGESNLFHGGLRYAPGRISKEEARVVGGLIEFGLKEISPKMTIKEAFEAMSKEKARIK
jgi:hypothetical protein